MQAKGDFPDTTPPEVMALKKALKEEEAEWNKLVTAKGVELNITDNSVKEENLVPKSKEHNALLGKLKKETGSPLRNADESITLGDYGVKDGDKLPLVLRLRGGAKGERVTR